MRTGYSTQITLTSRPSHTASTGSCQRVSHTPRTHWVLLHRASWTPNQSLRSLPHRLLEVSPTASMCSSGRYQHSLSGISRTLREQQDPIVPRASLCLQSYTQQERQILHSHRITTQRRGQPGVLEPIAEPRHLPTPPVSEEILVLPPQLRF